MEDEILGVVKTSFLTNEGGYGNGADGRNSGGLKKESEQSLAI